MSGQVDDFDENAVPEEGAPFDASHRGSIRKRRQQQKVVEQRRDAMLASILSAPHGRAWLAWLIHDVCGLYGATENAAYDTNGLHFKEGARAVGLLLHEEAMRAAPEHYILLMAENLKPKEVK